MSEPQMSPPGVIDWSLAMLWAHRSVERASTTRAIVEARLREANVFRNREFPLSPVPVLLRPEVKQWVAPITSYVRLLGDVVRLYRADPAIRTWYALGPEAEALIEADLGPGDAPWICRLDGYLDIRQEQLRILENNADAPAGTLFSARINALVRQICADLEPGSGSPAGVGREDDVGAFRRALLAGSLRAAELVPGKEARPQTVAVLQPSGQASAESVETVLALRAAGLDAYLGDPAGLRTANGRAWFGDRPADLCWNKINTVSWARLMSDSGLVQRWLRALRDTPMVHLNPFGARYVAENKRTLALVQEPCFADHFTAADREVVARLLPWSRCVTTVATGPDGLTPLTEVLLENPQDFVLKEPYDIRGAGVTIGYDTPRTPWRNAVEAAVAGGHLAQQRVVPARYPVVTPGENLITSMAFSLDTYVFGGEIAGFGSKASLNAKVNIFQGGQKLAVLDAEGLST